MSTRSMNIRSLFSPPDIKTTSKERAEFYQSGGYYIDESCPISRTIKWESYGGGTFTERFDESIEVERAVCENEWAMFDFVLSYRKDQYIVRQKAREERARIQAMSTIGGMLNADSIKALQSLAV